MTSAQLTASSGPQPGRLAQSKPKTKPKFRGVSHEIACYISAMAGVSLVSRAGKSEAALAGATIYSLCLFFLFASSTLYHRPNWSPEARARMRRVDHSAIYFLIAGTATPIGLLALQGDTRVAFLSVLWVGALLGVLKSLLWVNAPKKLATVVYILLSLAAAPFLPIMARQPGSIVGPGGWERFLALIVGGGAMYIVGGVIYAVKRPDPWPRQFGYHEIFHLLVIGAAACHYFAILGMTIAP